MQDVISGAAAVAILVFVAILIAQRRAGKGSPDGFDQNADRIAYASHGKLLTAAERSFFGVLSDCVGPSVYISAKVRLSDIIKPAAKGGAWKLLFNRIRSKHVDFVLCDAQTMAVVCCVELNDATHDQQSRQERDEFLAAALHSAQVPLATFQARRSYKLSEVKQVLQRHLNGSPEPVARSKGGQRSLSPS